MATDRQAFLEARCGKLGASDLAIVLGHGHGTAPINRLWHQKRQEFLTGKPAPSESSWPMIMGTSLEGDILDFAEREMGVTIRRDIPPLSHPDYPWFIGNLDGAIEQGGVRIPCDAKKVASWKREAWNGGTPKGYRVQVCVYAERCDAPHGYLIPAIGDDEPFHVLVPRDDDLVAQAYRAGADFMLAVEMGDEMFDDPDVQTSRADRDVVEEAVGELRDKVARWLRLREEIGPRAKEVEALAKELTALAPDGARKLALDGVPVVRFDQRANKRVDWDRLRAENPGLIDRYEMTPTYSTFPVAVRGKTS